MGGSTTAPSSVRLLDWLEGFGPEQTRVVDVRRILGILSGQDFTLDWRILPSLYRTDRKKYLFHKRRIDRLLRGSPSSVNAKRPWTPRRAVLGGPVNRLPEFTEVNGFFWNDNDGNHRVVVAKRKGHLRMKGTSYSRPVQARNSPSSSPMGSESRSSGRGTESVESCEVANPVYRSSIAESVSSAQNDRFTADVQGPACWEELR